MDINLTRATLNDCDLLAGMNLELIADEGSRNPMTQLELSERMRHWLQEGWDVMLLCLGNAAIGYALYQVRHDEYQPARTEVYIRQYFVRRVFRRRGIGRAAFEQLRASYFPPGATIALDVLATNPGARKFWERLGFKSYAANLRLEMRGDES